MCTIFYYLLAAVVVMSGSAYSFNRDTICNHLPSLTAQTIATGNDTFTEYLRYYGLDTIGIAPVAGTFQSDSFTCIGQIYRCTKSRGTVFLLHGLFDHAGVLASGIMACLQENYTVAAFDLPGHGLSGGDRAAIGDFSEYARALGQFIQICNGRIDTPYIFIGHSTGCAVGYEYVTTSGEQPFKKMIFLAPLGRSAFYHLSLVGNAVLQSFITKTPRWYRTASHDINFSQRQETDPLQPKKFSVRWASAYFLWWERAQAYRQQTLPLTVIQGTSDGVVDWRHNLPWFEEKVKGMTIVKITKARHQLLNEAEPYRGECFRQISKVLSSGN